MIAELFKSAKSPIQPVIFGKVPTKPDFVRGNASLPVVQEFDDHLQDALGPLVGNALWQEAYDRAGPADFCVTSSDLKWAMLGSLCPSRDTSGRRFPLFMGAVLPAVPLGGQRSALPLVGESFFEGSRKRLLKAAKGEVGISHCMDFLAEQGNAFTHWAVNHELALDIIQNFMNDNHPTSLEKPLNEKGWTFYQAILNIIFYRDFLRRFSGPSVLQVIEIPLSEGKGEPLLHATTWLNLLEGLFSPQESPCQDFLIQHGSGQTRLLLTFGRALPKTLSLALGCAFEKPQNLDLGLSQPAWEAHRLYQETAYALKQIIDNRKSNIFELKYFLVSLCEKLASITQ